MPKIIKNKSIKMDDGFQPKLIWNANLDGVLEMPSIDREEEIRIPDYLIPYSELKYCKKQNKFCCFYEIDKNFAEIITNPMDPIIIEKLKTCRGVITPDCTIDIRAPLAVQMMQIYRSRAIGAYFQSQGIYTVANVRFGDRRTFTIDVLPEPIAFLGIPKESIVSIGTYGAIKCRDTRKIFHEGLIMMIDYLKPSVVLVYGPMPDDIFGDLNGRTKFVQFDNWTKLRHLGVL